MRAKLVANAVSHSAYVLLLEAAALAVAQDIPLPVFYRLMERESGLMRPLTHRFGERLLLDVGQRDIHASLGQGAADAEADAASRSGDEGGLAVQVAH